MKVLERIQDGRDDVGAAADRFGEDDVGLRAGDKIVRPRDEIVEAAAEAAACDLQGLETLRAERVRIDQVGALVIRDDPDALAVRDPMLCELQDRRRLSGAEKAADNDETDWLRLCLRHADSQRTRSAILPSPARHSSSMAAVSSTAVLSTSADHSTRSASRSRVPSSNGNRARANGSATRTVRCTRELTSACSRTWSRASALASGRGPANRAR